VTTPESALGDEAVAQQVSIAAAAAVSGQRSAACSQILGADWSMPARERRMSAAGRLADGISTEPQLRYTPREP
jgi:hypothetical protein